MIKIIELVIVLIGVVGAVPTGWTASLFGSGCFRCDRGCDGIIALAPEIEREVVVVFLELDSHTGPALGGRVGQVQRHRRNPIQELRPVRSDLPTFVDGGAGSEHC